MSNKILILGADSFLGKSLTINFLQEGLYNIIGTSRKFDNKFYLDLNKPHKINFKEYEIVIFLAGISSIQDCERFPDLAYKTNYLSTVRLIQECANSGCFVIFFSSNSVFSGKKSFCKIDDTVDPKSKYGEYKVAVERWITENHKKNIAILRLTKVIPKKKTPPFVQRWINEIKDRGYTKVHTNHFLSPIGEREVFNALKTIINFKQGGIFHYGGLKEISYADYAKYLFRNDTHLLKSLKFINNEDNLVYNSLSTFLPD